MGHGTLDERFRPHPLDGVDGIQPPLVGPPPASQLRAGKEPDVTADGRQRRVRFERAHLPRQALPVHEVVGVHARDEAPAAAREPGRERRGEAAMGRPDDKEAIVRGRRGLGRPRRPVFRAVVDDDALPAGFGLPPDALQSRDEGRLGVEGRKEDGDERCHARAS